MCVANRNHSKSPLRDAEYDTPMVGGASGIDPGPQLADKTPLSQRSMGLMEAGRKHPNIRSVTDEHVQS